jgi:hypothetical protein
MKKLIPVFIFFSLLAGFSARAQAVKSFTHDSLKFLEELTVFFDMANKQDGKKYIQDDFKKYWLNDKQSLKIKMTDEEREFIYKTCNELMKKKYRPYPEFKNFLQSIMNAYDQKIPAKTMLEWKNSLNKVLEKGNKKEISQMLEAFELLFSENTIYKSNSVTWFAGNSNYSITHDSVPRVVWTQLDLYGAVKGDTLVIKNTKGIFFPLNDRWEGATGRVDWTRTGLDENQVYAELKRYKIQLRQQYYEADSAVFYNKQYFNKPLVGRLMDKAVFDAKPETSQYPRFSSYTKRYKIAGVVEGLVDYDGGFTMNGNKFVGSGSKEEDAMLVFKRNNKPFLIASSKGFIFKKGSISSQTVSVKMILDKDSIVHPGLQLNLNLERKELSLIRTQEGISKSPYYNTFHNIDMYIEELNWKLDSAKIDMRTLIGTTEGNAFFESSNYFREARFMDLMGYGQVNPLTQLKDYWKIMGESREFSGQGFASFLKYDLHLVQPMLIQLSAQGFIVYDLDDDKITLKEKVFDYIWAKAKKKDYDVLAIASTVKGGTNNAVMSLLNYDLKIYGVDQIFLSDSQNVFIYPHQRMIVMKKDRSFVFQGYVRAGLFDFYGKDFYFDYDNFKINLNNVDSLRLTVLEKVGDMVVQRKIKTVIENITGDLLIDDKGNKSGLKSQDYPSYPIFNSKKNAFVFYDKRSIQRGAYNRDNFYFKLDPFSIDSLDNLSAAGVDLAGDFVSAGIFPQMRENLKVQPDYSLGFKRTTGSDGLALYGNKGNFTTTVRLSHKGLQGDGTIKFLTSTAHSTDILFYPDSTNAHADTFYLVGQGKGSKVEFPNVKVDTAYIHFMPKKDFMQVYKVDRPFDMFDGEAKFHGRLDLRPKGLTGKGRIDFSSADLDANRIEFKNRIFESDTANFRLRSFQENLSAFSTLNVKAKVDFDKREGEFKSNGKGSIVKFDVNKYICFMDQFKWFMDKSEIELSASNAPKKELSPTEEITFEGPEFISVHQKQDSLRFYAPRARFDLKNYIISAKEVKYINIADARLYPDSGNVTILKDAVMKTFTNSKIIANSVTKYHTLFDVNANVFGRKSYSASGKYQYVDQNNQKHLIFFSNISVDTTFQTVAEAQIQDTSKFMLSPNFEFKWKAKLMASNQFLVFDGFFNIQHACNTIGKSWVKFNSQINPQKILIPIDSALYDDKDRRLASGVMSTIDSNAIYTSFLSKRVSRNDVEVLSSTGFLFYDKVTREYRIASQEKLTERNLTGQFLSMDANSCMVYGEGKINLGGDLGQVKMQTVGTVNHNLNNDSAYFDLMILTDFFFDNSALNKMADFLNACSSAPPTNFGRSVYEKGLREIMGKDKADKLISEINLYGKFRKFPDELEKAIFFTDLKMRWNARTKSYISSGKIGIGNIQKNQVNKMVDGVIELKRKRSGDELTIYLECDGTWFFFNYTNGIMQSISSKDEYNNIIKELKADKRQKEVQKGEKPYQFSLSTTTKKDLFVKKMKQQNASDD